MRQALVFDGVRSLDFQDIRTNVIRIAEVAARIREAQSIWDTISSAPLDLLNFIGSGDEVFLRHIRLKNFATAVVQMGLLDRYVKHHGLPDFILGAVNGDSPLKVAAGQMTFFDLVAESPALVSKTLTPVNDETGLPFLSGVELAEYGMFRRDPVNDTYRALSSKQCDLEKMVIELVEVYEVGRLITIGPGHSLSSRKIPALVERETEISESINLDPMLSWFWSNQQGGKLAIAN